MSYIRFGSKYKYVEGTSKDYIYPTLDNNQSIIIDYGDISNETLVELFCRHAEIKDCLLKEYLINNLAKKLNVKLKGE